VKTPERAAALLVCGTLERAAWRELDDDQFAAKVRERLASVDLELVAAGGRWLARPRSSGEEDGFEPTFHLHAVELAMVASLYLHLRYLPTQAGGEEAMNGNANGSGDGEEPSVELDDLLRPFAGTYTKHYLEQIVLGHLKKAGFCEQRDHRYFAGPYLAALDPVAANERAKPALDTFLLRRFLRERAAQLESEGGERRAAD
jgi:hypothetical protein